MAKIISDHKQGVYLHCHQLVDTYDGKVSGPHEKYPGAVLVTYGENDIDDGFWSEWKKQNPDSYLLLNKVLRDAPDPMSPQDAAIVQEDDAQEAKDSKPSKSGRVQAK